ncbi:hypothetical protein LCGC14_3148390, partial [marine sediment metagenome]
AIELQMGLGKTTITTKKTIKSVTRVFNGDSTERTVSGFSGTTITLSAPVTKGAWVYIEYVQNISKSFVGLATHLGNGIFQAKYPEIATNQGSFKGQIVAVKSLSNTTKDVELNLFDFWEDRMLATGPADPDDVFEVDCTYIEPFRFLITRVEQRERHEDSWIVQDGQLSMSYDGFHDIGPGDIVTLLRANQKISMNGEYTGVDFEVPVFQIDNLLRIEDKHGLITSVSVIRNTILPGYFYNGESFDELPQLLLRRSLALPLKQASTPYRAAYRGLLFPLERLSADLTVPDNHQKIIDFVLSSL